MAKRGAQSDINHDNWDQEEEPEEPGVFKQASVNAMKGRTIKKAKRRGAGGEESGSVANTPSLFKGFTGFTSSNPKPAAFSFNTDNKKPLGGLSNGGMAPFSLGTPGSTPSFGSAAATSTFSSSDRSDAPKEAKKESGTTNGSTPSKSKYLSQLRALNESVSKWISDHVSKNGHCILTPIFKDYEKHLNQIELLNPDRKTGVSKTEVKLEGSPSKESEGNEAGDDKGEGVSKPFGSGISSGFKFTASSNFPCTSTFQTCSSTSASLFGKDMKSTPSGTGFPLTSFKHVSSDNKPFSFAVAAAAASSGEANKDEEEEYQPPKPDVKEIEEEGAFYTKRCKLYYQKDGQWVDRGVGNLHLKPCEGKTQLLVRADTNLGNILLNIMLSSTIPVSRQGKNHVSLMCVPNPPIDPKDTSDKPTGMLIKVKTSEDADELFEKMKESKK